MAPAEVDLPRVDAGPELDAGLRQLVTGRLAARAAVGQGQDAYGPHSPFDDVLNRAMSKTDSITATMLMNPVPNARRIAQVRSSLVG
jgi:hypothetical protein